LEVPIMQAVLKDPKTQGKAIDNYLGYSIQEISGWYLAIPCGWVGEVLEAGDLPHLRLKIWRWWHQLS
jgi:hypothetical protein